MATVKEQLQKIVTDGKETIDKLDGTIMRKEDAGEDAEFARGMVMGILHVIRKVEYALDSDEMYRLMQLDENGAYYSQQVP